MELLSRSPSNAVRKGSNPMFVTKRSKIQSERSVLNQQLNKQMRLRAGAENLYNATSNVKVKETVALELSFLNSNLQLLKEELSVLNSQITPYQNDSAKAPSMAMISLGLKETKDLDFTQPLKDFILEHYSEDPDGFDDEIADLIDLRNSIRTPARSDDGLSLLKEYFGQLYFIDYRFFPPDRQLCIHFHWYDSVTGIPSMQKSMSLEKASIVFNIGALHSQIGTRADRCRRSGITEAVKAYEHAAGIFNDISFLLTLHSIWLLITGAFDYVRQNFSHSPCTDLSHAFLAVMSKLMLAQAQECVFEKELLGGFEIELGKCISIAQHAAKVAENYTLVHTAMTVPPVSDTIPPSWISMTDVKSHHYKAIAHYYTSIGLLDQIDIAEVEEISTLLSSFYLKTDFLQDLPTPQDIAKRREDRKRLGRAHLAQAVFHHEQAESLLKVNKALSKVETLQNFLSLAHKRSLEKKTSLGSTDKNDLFEIFDVPDISPLTEIEAQARQPMLTSVKGPLSVFSARQKFTAPRQISIAHLNDGWGFTLTGDSPVRVTNVSRRLKDSGLKEDDVITAVEGRNVKWKTCSEVMDIIDKYRSSFEKKEDQKLERVITNVESSSPVITIKVTTLISTEMPKTAGKMVSESSSISDDMFYSSHGLRNGSGAMDFTSTLPVKRRLKRNEGTKSLSAARSKQRHSVGFFQGLKMRLKPQPTFSTPTENPYASTSSLDKVPRGHYSLMAMNFSPVSIPKATPSGSTLGRGVRRSETFAAPNRPQVTRFTKTMDIGLY